MKFTEAFESLGYNVESPRQDWSAVSEHGVCITIWQKEMAWDHGVPYLDSRIHGNPHQEWAAKPGNHKRIRHLSQAMQNFNGKVDVVIVNGTPGQSYEDAHPWVASERKAYWQIEFFDPETGHFVARAKKAITENSPKGPE